MTQVWMYCSTKLPFKNIANWKMKWLRFIARRRDKKYKGYIFDWYVPERNYQAGLQQLYHKASKGEVDGIMIRSLNDIGDEEEQFKFMVRMQELNIPVFCLKKNDYLSVEESL